MSFRLWRSYLFIILLLLLSSVFGSAQGPAPADQAKAGPEVEGLREQIRLQAIEIEKLRADIGNEAALRKAQQRQLDRLLEKLDRLAAALSDESSRGGTNAGAAAPVNLKESESSPTSAKVAGPAGDATKPAQTATPNTVETGIGKVKFTGLVQGWFAAGDQGFNDTFRMRRAEMRFSGDIMPNVRWSIMFDLAKALSVNSSSTTIDGVPVVRTVGINQASRIFQEAYITLSHFKKANIQFGQFKIPVSHEGLQSSAALDTVERALFLTDRARGGGLGDARDIGVMAFGPLSDQIDYQLGIFNGAGESQNDVDQNEQKTAAGRFVFRPSILKGLQIGGSGAFGIGTNSPSLRRDRLGAELVYTRGSFRIKSELMTGVDGDIHRRGYYAHFGYRVHPKVEGIFRFDMFDPDIRSETSAASATERDYIGGINYFIKENNFKLQFNYIRKTFASPAVRSRNLFLVNLQTSW